MSISKPKPTVVLVHGSWHSPEHFAPLETNLRSHGYRTNSVWLPSMHYARLNPPANPATITIHDDINAVRSAITDELSGNAATDLVVLSHSYGTTPAAAAIKDLDKSSRKKGGHENSVVGFLIIAGLIIPSGMTALEWAGGKVPPSVSVSTIPDPRDITKEIQISRAISDPGPIALFYHDLADQEEAKRYEELCTHQIWAVHTTVIPFQGWKLPGLDVFYLVTEEDRAIPPGFQRVMVENANQERAIMVSSMQAGSRNGGIDRSTAGHGGDLLERYQKESLAGIEASKAILVGVEAGKMEESPAVKAEEGGSSIRQHGGERAGASSIQVTSIQSSHSPFLSRVEETAQWVRRCCGEEL